MSGTRVVGAEPAGPQRTAPVSATSVVQVTKNAESRTSVTCTADEDADCASGGGAVDASGKGKHEAKANPPATAIVARRRNIDPPRAWPLELRTVGASPLAVITVSLRPDMLGVGMGTNRWDEVRRS